MPPEGFPHLAHDEILTFEEITRFVRVMADLGVKKIRLTGGEPLVRRDVVNLVKSLHEIKGIEEIDMTTNGILFSEYASELKKAGLSRVNISLDTLNEETFKKITGFDGLNLVLEGIESAIKEGFPVKINCVPCAPLNQNDLVSVALLAKKKRVDVRFIEMMPLGCGKDFSPIMSDELLHSFEEKFGKAELCPHEKHSPAVTVQFPGFKGKVGFISPMSHAFCSECNRVRLTASGLLKFCLCFSDGLNIKDLLRSDSDDTKLKNEVLDALKKKPEAHTFNSKAQTEKKMMAQIGG
jgi:cyclic pyranopterin phosphate synthase